ncbi:AsmA-like C-terminal region-containing protein [Ferrimonas balearica]|nr:AsmA-like C-terminal region-containing protein [Ferrimonas balearica]
MHKLKPQPQALAARPRHHRVLGRLARVLLLLVLLAGLGAGLGGLRFLLRGEPLVAPPWLRERIETRLEAQVPGLEIAFSELSVVFEEAWHPRLRVRDLNMILPETGSRVVLNQATTRLAPGPLLRGRLQPQEIAVEGAQLRVRRNADGRFDLMSPDQGTEARERDISLVLAELKASLGTRDLAALDRIEGLGLTLVYEDLRADRSWSVDGGRIVLDRDGAALVIRGDFSLLGGRSYATLIETSYTTRLDSNSGEFQLSVEDMPAEDLATQSPALAWLGVLRAPLSGALRLSLEEDGAVGPLYATLQIGRGVVRPSEGTRPIPFDSARSYFSFDPATQMLRFSELSVASPVVSLLAEGAFRLGTAPDGGVQMTGQLAASEIVADPADIFAAPLRLERAEADLRLRFDPFELSLGELILTEGEHVMRADGQLVADDTGWSLGLEGALTAAGQDAEGGGGPGATLSPDDVLGFWPPAVAVKSRDWVARNLLEARLTNLQFGLRAAQDAPPQIQLGFDFDDTTLIFMKTMPPLQQARGRAVLSNRRFAVQADAGHAEVPGGGRIDAAGSTFVVPNVRQKPADGELGLRLTGALGDMLTLLDRDPLNLLSKSGRSPDLAQGQARLAASLKLPLMKKVPLEAISLSYAGEVRDVESDTLAPGHVLRAPLLQVTGGNDHLRVAGQGTLDGVGFDGAWQTDIGPGSGPSTVAARLRLDAEGAEGLGLALPPGTLRGAAQADLSLELPRDAPMRFEIESDLAGLGLSVPSLGWSLSQAATGTVRAEGEMGPDGVRVEAMRLEAPGLALSGALTATQGGTLGTVRLDRLAAGRWLDVSAQVTPRGAGQAPGLALTGGRVDLTQRPDLPQGGGSGAMDVALDRLQITDTLAVTGLRGALSAGGTARGQGRFRGRINGGAEVFAQLDGGRIRIEAADASAALADAGYLKRGNGGALVLDLVPTGAPGTYDGSLRITDIRIQEAGAVAELLNALSIVGLLEQLSGPGILFGTVEAEFRLSPDRLTVTRASAVGASMGVSLDGVYDLAADQLRMQGVVSPLYMLNGIGALLTRKGEGLIGFNFDIDGSASAPRVRVNPLSIFTPAMFREIFRRPPPDPGGQ